ncbi:FAD-binding oxidoreductase [Hyphobacterium sp. CCMP332]|nr:FAD-binding oxidoreductase [Hyphobacterium sp. CCMP332]
MISFWENVFYKSDIIIVGAGISGLSLANALIEKSPNLSVSVLEKDAMPSSASTRNAGFACFGSFTELISDKAGMGKDQMLKLVEQRWKGLELLRKRLGDKNIDYRNYGGFEILNQEQIRLLDRLEEINDDLKGIFGINVFSEKIKLISKFNFNPDWCKALLFNPLEGQLHSGLMIKRLRELATERGVQIFSGIEINNYKDLGKAVELYSVEGHRFLGKKVVFCNNAYLKKLTSDLDIYPGRGLVMISEEMDLPFEGSFHFDEGFYYFRNVGRRFLIGGGRNEDFKKEETFDKEINENIQNAIREKSSLILNGKEFKEEMWWSGIMAFGNSKSPIVKSLSQNVKIGVRLSGMGVALASQIAEELSLELVNEM